MFKNYCILTFKKWAGITNVQKLKKQIPPDKIVANPRKKPLNGRGGGGFRLKHMRTIRISRAEIRLLNTEIFHRKYGGF